jgi:hypothetical protein
MLVVRRWMRASVDAGHGSDDFGRLVEAVRQNAE